MIHTLVSVLGTRASLLRLATIAPLILLLLFLFTKLTFLVNLVVSDFPFRLLIEILPSLAADFLFGDFVMLLHYVLISLLLSVYLLLLHHLFVRKQYLSIASVGTGLAGLFGISVGLVCISCGALAGLVLVSILGALSLPLTLIHNTVLFLVVGELLLSLSILLALYTLKRFSA